MLKRNIPGQASKCEQERQKDWGRLIGIVRTGETRGEREERDFQMHETLTIMVEE